MKFPIIQSVDLNKLPTDSSELTSQEKYIFETIFQPDVQMYREQTIQQPLQQGIISNFKDQIKSRSLIKKIIVSLALTGIIVLYSWSPAPCIISSFLRNSPMYILTMVIVLFILSFFLLEKFIK